VSGLFASDLFARDEAESPRHHGREYRLAPTLGVWVCGGIPKPLMERDDSHRDDPDRQDGEHHHFRDVVDQFPSCHRLETCLSIVVVFFRGKRNLPLEFTGYVEALGHAYTNRHYPRLVRG
jgi:hypothetical protein